MCIIEWLFSKYGIKTQAVLCLLIVCILCGKGAEVKTFRPKQLECSGTSSCQRYVLCLPWFFSNELRPYSTYLKDSLISMKYGKQLRDKSCNLAFKHGVRKSKRNKVREIMRRVCRHSLCISTRVLELLFPRNFYRMSSPIECFRSFSPLTYLQQ